MKIVHIVSYFSERGGGIECGTVTITGCVIKNNSAGNAVSGGSLGGGITCIKGSPTINNCEISGNTAGWGGAIACDFSSSPIITDCIIKGISRYPRIITQLLHCFSQCNRFLPFTAHF